MTPPVFDSFWFLVTPAAELVVGAAQHYYDILLVFFLPFGLSPLFDLDGTDTKGN